jgi:hypothetical protein
MQAPVMSEPMARRRQVLACQPCRRALANLPAVELPWVNWLLANPTMVRWKVWDPARLREKPKSEPGRTKVKGDEEFA